METKKLTNEQKQRKKPLANTVPPDTARPPEADTKIKLHSEDYKYAEKAVCRMGETLGKIRDENGYTNAQMMFWLSTEHFKSEEAISRLINQTLGRLPSAGQMFDIRRVFGISLDALADGGDPFVFERMSDARLVEMMEAISRELGRRIRQK